MAPSTTSPTSAASGRERPAPGARRAGGGFTLIEMLVVIGILVLLAGLLFPVVRSTLRKADRARTRADLNAIGSALEAYKADFGDYPRVLQPPATAARPVGWRIDGAQILCWALIGPRPAVWGQPQGATVPPGYTANAPADGADGPGFRTTPPVVTNGVVQVQGKVWGPYLPPDKFKLADPFDRHADLTKHSVANLALIDRQGFIGIEQADSSTTAAAENWPQWAGILYFPAATNKPDIRKQIQVSQGLIPSYVSNPNPPNSAFTAAGNEMALYDSLDNIAFFRRRTEGSTNTMALQRMRMVLGDLAGSAGGMTPPNGIIDSTETAAYEGPFILWAPGPDGKYGPDWNGNLSGVSDQQRRVAVQKCDDVTNFRD